MVWGKENEKIYKDREEAGIILAERLEKYRDKKPVILALPKGGVPVAFQVAKSLKAPLDTVISRKLGAPNNREFGFGAIAPGDVIILNKKIISSLDLTQLEIEDVMRLEREELDRRMMRFRSGQYVQDVDYDTAIIVDDGLATGVTARAAIESVKIVQKPKKIVFAVPVCAKEAVKDIEKEVDDLIYLSCPKELLAIGQWYRKFEQVGDEKVVYYLSEAKKFWKRE